MTEQKEAGNPKKQGRYRGNRYSRGGLTVLDDISESFELF